MLVRLLESRLVDVLLIAAALYFLFPKLFKRNRKSNKEPENKTVIINKEEVKKTNDNDKGEYIDYEEIK
jgi:hypothetical protein